MRKVKNLVIGAGITGLTFAYDVKSDYLIVEKESEPGGYCRSIRTDEFIWDYAGHFFHFKNQEMKDRFESWMPEDQIIIQKKVTGILYKDKLIDYPFQTNIHQLEKDEFIDCLYDLFNKEEKENYDNFLDMLYGKFGKSIVEKFLKPYNEKLYAVDLKELDQDAMGRFFPYADKQAIIDNMKKSENSSYNDNFLYLKNGTGSFIDVLYSKIDSSKVLFNTSVTSIDLENKIAVLSNGEEIQYEYLVNSAPFNKFLELIKDRPYESLREELSYNKVLVLNLGFNKKSKYTKEHWMYIPDKAINFYRIGFYDNILGTDKLSMYVEVGYSKDGKIDVEKELAETLINLEKIGITDADTKLIDKSIVVMDPAYVHINAQTLEKVSALMDDFAGKNAFSIGRYGKWTYCSMEDAMIEAKELAESILAETKA